MIDIEGGFMSSGFNGGFMSSGGFVSSGFDGGFVSFGYYYQSVASFSTLPFNTGYSHPLGSTFSNAPPSHVYGQPYLVEIGLMEIY